MNAGFPAGTVLGDGSEDTDTDDELRIAFDFDGVIVDDKAERIYQEHNLDVFHESETKNALEPMDRGLYLNFLNSFQSFRNLTEFKKLKCRVIKDF